MWTPENHDFEDLQSFWTKKGGKHTLIDCSNNMYLYLFTVQELERVFLSTELIFSKHSMQETQQCTAEQTVHITHFDTFTPPSCVIMWLNYL